MCLNHIPKGGYPKMIKKDECQNCGFYEELKYGWCHRFPNRLR